MRTIATACSELLLLLSASETASQVPPSDPELLKNVVAPALRLLADPNIYRAVKPYTDCYSNSVVASSVSSLKDNEAVQRAEELAQAACKTAKQSSTMQADAALAARSPNTSPEARAALLGKVRRQGTLFALMSEYQRNGRGAVFQRYLERIGKEARAGRSVVMLSGE